MRGLEGTGECTGTLALFFAAGGGESAEDPKVVGLDLVFVFEIDDDDFDDTGEDDKEEDDDDLWEEDVVGSEVKRRR